ncbi:MAG: hypothetical protein FD161_3526 [Limisphaerales bacterium]|nr:MAG: hypothetical protein FD161_3526 [Limisphaerales bacterium]KAG0507659.1 MAG: hypothetical protein E1N63_3192 [Limisphaerales bacterium]TXT51778.1 MAG: hypothetical protein FD140_1419 [Limisphaerales bacterium]
MKLEQLKFSALGPVFHFHEHPEFREPLRVKLDDFLIVIAGNGEGSPYLKGEFRDAAGEVFPLICFLDDASELRVKSQLSMIESRPFVEVEGQLFDWAVECGVTLLQCKLVQPA